jgi:hypothetical protein
MNELTKIIFEKLNLEAGEKFKIVLSNGDESVNNFFIDNDLNVWNVVKEENADVSRVKESSITIKDLILGEYFKIKKLPKPLLTKKEKEFLNYFRFDSLKKVQGRALIFSIYPTPINCIRYSLSLNALKLKFNGLKYDKEYSKEELGL